MVTSSVVVVILQETIKENKPSTAGLSKGKHYSRRLGYYSLRMGFYTIGVIAAAFIGQCYIGYQFWKLENRVYRKVASGSRPKLLYGNVIIPRKDDELLRWYVQRDLSNYSSAAAKQFGVIVGPTGTYWKVGNRPKYVSQIP